MLKGTCAFQYVPVLQHPIWLAPMYLPLQYHEFYLQHLKQACLVNQMIQKNKTR